MNVKQWLARAAFAIARSSLGKALVGLTFAHLSFVLPVRRIRETTALIAFHHPKPAYRVHILIVPKRIIPGLEALDEFGGGLLPEIFQMAGHLIQELELEGAGAQLIVNGGKYQDVPQLHFHLVCDPVSEAISPS